VILLVLGLALFLGAHSVQIFAAPWREAFIARRGPGPWKGLYSALAGVGFVLLIVGYGQARGAAPLWARPAGAEHITAALVLAGFILLTAAYWPGNHIKALVRDPMVAGVGAWALGHLLVKSSPAALPFSRGFCSGRCSISSRCVCGQPRPTHRRRRRRAWSIRWGRWWSADCSMRASPSGVTPC
jgi:uncharacterized membrane protein